MYTRLEGTQRFISIREEDLNARFPGLLQVVLHRQSHIKNISYSYEMFLIWLFFNKSNNPLPSDVRSYPKGTVLLISCAYISGSDNFRPYSFSHCLMSKASAPATHASPWKFHLTLHISHLDT